MSLDTRHTEKSILFRLLTSKTLEDFEETTIQLMATMEPEDVELVQKRVAELNEKKYKKE